MFFLITSSCPNIVFVLFQSHFWELKVRDIHIPLYDLTILLTCHWPLPFFKLFLAWCAIGAAFLRQNLLDLRRQKLYVHPFLTATWRIAIARQELPRGHATHVFVDLAVEQYTLFRTANNSGHFSEISSSKTLDSCRTSETRYLPYFYRIFMLVIKRLTGKSRKSQ